jgi:hypothetical protein
MCRVTRWSYFLNIVTLGVIVNHAKIRSVNRYFHIQIRDQEMFFALKNQANLRGFNHLPSNCDVNVSWTKQTRHCLIVWKTYCFRWCLNACFAELSFYMFCQAIGGHISLSVYLSLFGNVYWSRYCFRYMWTDLECVAQTHTHTHTHTQTIFLFVLYFVYFILFFFLNHFPYYTTRTPKSSRYRPIAQTLLRTYTGSWQK